jgi:hypothetical protein
MPLAGPLPHSEGPRVRDYCGEPHRQRKGGTIEHAFTTEQLTEEIRSVTSGSDARAVQNRASRVAGVPQNRALERDELLRVCAALAAEGGMIQQIAESIAGEAVRP